MFPAPFDYHRADSVGDALALLGRLGGDAVLIAGGQSLVSMMKLRMVQPAAVVDIGRVAELRGITEAGDAIRIGALTTHAELAASNLVRRRCPLLAQAASQIADPQVRNAGTVGGNIAHFDPGSDLPPALVAAGATVHLRGAGGERTVAAADFFVGLMTTLLAEREVILAVEAPAFVPRTGSAYHKFEHPGSDYTLCGTAAIVTLDRGGTVVGARLCFTGVTATPYDARPVTDALAGSDGSDEAIAAAVAEHLAIPDPIGDRFASPAYRAAVAGEFGRRALIQARDAARG
jgi:carbon-monoxide dehydrogenase medium subunit